jgi:hypothetical protein
MQKHTRKAIAEILDRSRLLLLSNLLVLLLVRCSLEALPWQSAAQEVHEDMAERLKVVSSGLLATKMRVDTHVPSGTRQRLAFPVGDVLLRLGVTVLLGHAKVDNVDDVGALGTGAANKEVVGLDVPVDEVLLMDRLDSRQLGEVSARKNDDGVSRHTICFATMTTVLMENFLLQWSNKSSKLGPSRSITRMLCRPSWPK